MNDELKSAAAPGEDLHDENFAEFVLDQSDRFASAAVLFYRQDCAESLKLLDELAEVASAGHTVFAVDSGAAKSRSIVERFAVGPVPQLILFRGGRFRAIFDESRRTARAIGLWMARDASSFAEESAYDRDETRSADGGTPAIGSSLTTLTKAEFEREVLSRDTAESVLVHFLLRDVPECRSAERVMRRVEDNGWIVFNVDLGCGEEIGERFAIGTLPAVFLFKGGHLISNYTGPYEAAEIGWWAAHHDRAGSA